VRNKIAPGSVELRLSKAGMAHGGPAVGLDLESILGTGGSPRPSRGGTDSFQGLCGGLRNGGAAFPVLGSKASSF
jgi:hypothetical protein